MPSPQPAADEAAQRRRAVALTRQYRADFASWAAALFRIRSKAERLIPFRLNRVQRQIAAAEAELLRTRGEARYFVLKARQGGVSTYEQARNLHLIWSASHTAAFTLAHTKDDTDKIFQITDRAVKHFPEGWLPLLGPRATREISFPGRDAFFWTGTAGAKRTGRGTTLRRVHGSEFAFWDDPRGMLNTLTPALTGVPGSVIALETTASGYGTSAHEFWQAAVQGRNDYRALFFPWWECDPAVYRLPLLAPDELGRLEPEERDLVERRGLDLEQIKWRRRMVRDMGHAEFLQEYAEDDATCWLVGGGLYYDVAVLKALQARQPAPRKRLLGGALELFDEPPAGEQVVIGCDTAEGTGHDRSAWVARAFPSWRLLATCADARLTPEALADQLHDWGRHFGMALLVVEKNAHGITVLRRLRDVHKYPLGRIYHRAALDSGQEQAVRARGDRIGWHTSGETKPLMLDAGRALLQAAHEGTIGLVAAGVVADAFTVRRDLRGRVDLGGRDLLVAEMLAWLGRDQLHTWEAW